jgi:hypothetical protein
VLNLGEDRRLEVVGCCRGVAVEKRGKPATEGILG